MSKIVPLISSGTAGLLDGEPRAAINLNNLDDWDEFHAAEIK